MSRLIVVCLAAVITLTGTPASAQDVESLRREVELLRKQLQSVTDRLQAIESRPTTAPPAAPVPQAPASIASSAPVAATPGAAAPAAPAPLTTAAGPPAPGLADYARPHQPFALAERRGPGQLLFDIGVSADFVANLTQRNVEQAQGGTFAGQENRFFPRAIELGLFGQIDPYARGVVRFEAGETVEDGERGIHVEVSEAHLTLLTLPFNTQLKLGRMLNRFGMLNQIHEDDLPQIDRPNVLTRFLGPEGLNENGAELTWVAPLPFYLEALVGLFSGDNEVAFGRGSLRAPLVTARLRTFFELDDANAIQLGVSAANGETSEEHRDTLAGVDFKYKLVPDGWRHPLLTVGSEALFANRKVDVTGDSDGDGTDDLGGTRTRKRWGWYAYAELQPWQRWAFGFRYDWTQYPTAPGSEWAVEPYVTFKPSDFLRFRLAYKYTDRTHRVTGPDDRGSARVVDEILFQATFLLGAHPTDAF
jgi:hypothetical protein